MPQQLVTAQDLDDWSPRLDARSHLPTLIRRLVFASTRPDHIVVPDAEGTGAPGLDGIVHTTTGVPPYVPAGRSAWEFGTSKDPRKKASEDYLKRTRQLSADERAITTIVLVTTRIWERSDVDDWIKRRAKGGWAAIQVITAEDLATWLPQCPGVLAWLEDHCGRNPFGRTALRDWWTNWANQTEPPIPPSLLIAGRQTDRTKVLGVLSGGPTDQVIATRTEDEAIAFLAGALLAGPIALADGGEDMRTDEERAADSAADASLREALLERAVVVHESNAWRSLAVHHEPLILIPTAACEPTIDAAVTSGHHVVLPQVARPGDPGLERLDRPAARDAWERAGVPFDRADDLARAARRSLTSLQRRIGRAGRFRRPTWSSGTSSTLLGPLLLVGAWDPTFAGDERIVLELADRASLRSLDRDLAAIAAEPDPPLQQRKNSWEFTDPIDAWEQLATVVTTQDLDLFQQRAVEVLTYRTPTADLTPAERLAADIAGELPKAEYSGKLRRGIAETLGILGAVRGDTILPGGKTGAERAARTVHELVNGATAGRWMELVDVLPVLAEAAPSVMLDAIEASLRDDDPAIMTLFRENEDALGLSSSSPHTHLLWALESLAFSPTYLSRVAVILGQLAERDPGGKLQNRPDNSLRDILHPVIPQSAVDMTSRLAAVDAVRQAAPDAAWQLLGNLMGALNRGMILNHGPRYRDWPRASRPTRRDVIDTVTGIGDRLIDDAAGAPERWADALKFVTDVPAAVRARMLQATADVWGQLPEDEQRSIVAQLQEKVQRHTKFHDSAWALDAAGLAEIEAFVEAHATEADEPGTHLLFTWWPEVPGIDPETDEGKATLKVAREEAARAAVPDGIGALAEASELPELVGVALAAVTADHDDEMLGWLALPERHLRAVGHGLARVRQENDPDWLLSVIASHADLTVELLLTGELNDTLIEFVDGLVEDAQAEFWSKVNPWNVDQATRLTVVQRLLDRDRPFSAMNLLYRDDSETLPIDLALAVLAKPLEGTREDIQVLHQPSYMLSRMLDRLDEAGAPPDQVAMLEWFYEPALHHTRAPQALHRLLAGNPVLFARLVALTITEDDPDDTADPVDPVAAPTSQPLVGREPDDDTWKFADTPDNRVNAFQILREWHLPLPGASDNEAPDTATLQAWVNRARAELAALRRTGVAGQTIGQAISGPVHDPDGTWPCQAVRDVLEHENDAELENGVWLGRVNARGVTTRGAFSGGRQERALAEEHRGWADQVRGTWTRAGALLDSLADFYDADGRREDESADDLGDH